MITKKQIVQSLGISVGTVEGHRNVTDVAEDDDGTEQVGGKRDAQIPSDPRSGTRQGSAGNMNGPPAAVAPPRVSDTLTYKALPGIVWVRL
jgi:hypothetical protein